MVSHKVGTKEQQDAARQALLEAEKELTRKNDEVTRLRGELPWVKLEQDYQFEGLDGPVSLSGLFKEGRKDLVVVHFMFDPDWDNACSRCCCFAETYTQQLPFFQDKFNFAVVAKAPVEKLKKLMDRKGWSFPMYSSQGSTFNKDFEVEDTVAREGGKEVQMSQAQGLSVFRFEEGVVYHTYSTYNRGMEKFTTIWAYLDALPGGREKWQPQHKEEYTKKRKAPVDDGQPKKEVKLQQPEAANAVGEA